jgi:hypothetical protein
VLLLERMDRRDPRNVSRRVKINVQEFMVWRREDG